MTCHRCGDKGHFEAECPNAGIDASGKPPWCGFCDEDTRLIDSGDIVSRCQECHPNRHRMRHPLRRCQRCKVVVYEWDHAPCGHHVGPDIPDQRPDRDHIDAVIATAR